MLKAMAVLPNGRKLVVLGLSFGNLQRFLSMPGDTYIQVDGKEMELDTDILLFSGETEARMTELMSKFITKDTIVHIADKLKS